MAFCEMQELFYNFSCIPQNFMYPASMLKKTPRKMFANPVEVPTIQSLKILSLRRGVPVAQLVRQALREFVERENGAKA